MSVYAYDYFTTEQSSGSKPYSSGVNWGPPSTRVIETDWSDNGTVLESLFPNGIISGTFIVYEYNSTISFPSGTVKLPFTSSNLSADAVSGNSVAELFLNTSSGASTFYSSSPSSGPLPDNGTLEFTIGETTGVIGLGIAFGNVVVTENTGYIKFSSFTVTEIITCLAAGSKILTKQGYKPIETLQRGDETPQGKIARIIVEELRDHTVVKLAKVRDLLACANHSFLVQGKRVLAKDLPQAELMEGFAKDVLSDNKLYDIQYDFEGSYTVWTGEKELESQSRSPYCKCTPLSKELYWKEENYKDLLVDNTLQEY